jgi:hypothetical protein
MKKTSIHFIKIIKLTVLTLFTGFYLGCNFTIQEKYADFDILSPKNNRIYYTDEKILFSTNLKNLNLEWTSSIDGFLGTQSLHVLLLSEGIHEIQLRNKRNNITKSVIIKVEEKINPGNEWHLLTSLPQELNLKNDINNIGFCSLAGFCKNIKTHTQTKEPNLNSISSKEKNPIKKDFCLNYNKTARLLEQSVYSRSGVQGKIPEEEIFFVINTANQNDFYKIKVEKYYANDKIAIYIEKKYFEKNDCKNKLDKCIRNLITIILPRLKILWGECADVDNNGLITILFSSTINEEKTAVGFFYPNDLFKIDKDKMSNSYNPFSNEKDMIYVAFPIDEDSNYSTGSICATLAHEMAHAINFSNRVVFPLMKNQAALEQMETFLDEGLSHLTESLCGFGDSGGNSNFVNFYLENSAYYSFCKNDIYGSTDSIGQRGAICLFLYYLFEKSGGISWNEKS